MKILIVSLLLALLPVGLAQASTTMFPAHSGHNDAPVLIVYSSLDEPLAKPMIAGFQAAHPDVAVRYAELLTGEIYVRIVREPDAGQKTAGFHFSPRTAGPRHGTDSVSMSVHSSARNHL